MFRKSRSAIISITLFAFIFFTACGDADPGVSGGHIAAPSRAELTGLLPTDSISGALFGSSVSIYDTTAVAGAYENDGINKAGSAFVFEYGGDTWGFSQKLLPADGAVGDWFGYSVAASGDTVVVGAPKDDDEGNQSGSAYLFIKSGASWVQAAKLNASDGAKDNRFGTSVSISGNTIVIGSPFSENYYNNDGAAYVYVKPAGGWTNMTETAKLSASDGANGDGMGFSVAVFGDTVISAAHQHNFYTGAVYVYEKPGGGWANMTETAKLTASDGVSGDSLGFSAAISGDTVIAGAYGDDIYKGSVYVFVKPAAGWTNMTESGKLTASDGDNGDRLGSSVAIFGDTAVAGAYADDDKGSASGSAYVFKRPAGGWASMTQTSKLTPSDGTADAFFGYSVAVSQGMVISGAYGADGSKGKAYLYNK